MADMDSISWAMHHLAVATAEVDAATARRMKLSAGDYLALKHLIVAPEPLGPAELGRLLGITSGAATGLVDRLAQAGFVTREPHPGDRRRQTVTTTPRARDAMLRELQPLADDLDRFATELTAEQHRLITEALDRLTRLHRHHARPGGR
jgi:DNA-binding MarR family transcriptional regulator